MSHFTLLGTSSGAAAADRDYTHLVWHGTRSGRPAPLLIDTGTAPFRHLLRAGVSPHDLSGVLLTHSHCDHICGLPSLIFSSAIAGRGTPLPIYGLPSTLEIVRRVLEAFRLDEYMLPVVWRPFAPGDSLGDIAGDGWRVTTAPTVHNRPCVALRFDEDATGRSYVYSSDTAPSEIVTALARNVDVLIHEGTTPRTMAGKHCSPRDAGAIAARAGAKKLVIVHYTPNSTLPPERVVDEIRRGGFTGPARVGHPGMRVGNHPDCSV